MALATLAAGTLYTSVTLAPPPNWELAPLYINGVTVAANSSNQYVCASISNATVQDKLGQGWTLVSVTP